MKRGGEGEEEREEGEGKRRKGEGGREETPSIVCCRRGSFFFLLFSYFRILGTAAGEGDLALGLREGEGEGQPWKEKVRLGVPQGVSTRGICQGDFFPFFRVCDHPCADLCQY